MLPVEQPFKTYTGLDGKPLDNGYVYIGKPNVNPVTNPVTVYWDAAGTIPAAQPLRTSGGYIMRAGTPANVFCDGVYSELVQDSKKRQVFYSRDSSEFNVAMAFQLADYAALRAYKGAQRNVYVTGSLVTLSPSGIAGNFIVDDRDTSSPDNGGTIIVSANGKRWKRDMAGRIATPQWFELPITSSGIDNTAKIQAVLDCLHFEFPEGFQSSCKTLYPRSNSTGDFKNAKFTLMANQPAGTQLVVLGDANGYKCQDSIFYGGIFDGNRANNTASNNPGTIAGGDGGMHGIQIHNAKGVRWYGPKLINFGTDGIIVWQKTSIEPGGATEVADVHVYSPYLDNNARNNLSVIACDDMHFYGLSAANSGIGAGAKSPKANIDIEGNNALDNVSVYFHGRTFCTGSEGRGIMVHNPGGVYNITFEDVILQANNVGDDGQFVVHLAAGNAVNNVRARKVKMSGSGGAQYGMQDTTFVPTTEAPVSNIDIDFLEVDAPLTFRSRAVLDIGHAIVRASTTTSDSASAMFFNPKGRIRQLDAYNTSATQNGFSILLGGINRFTIESAYTQGRRGMLLNTGAENKSVNSLVVDGAMTGSALRLFNAKKNVVNVKVAGTMTGDRIVEIDGTSDDNEISCVWEAATGESIVVSGARNRLKIKSIRATGDSAVNLLAASTDNLVHSSHFKGATGAGFVANAGTGNLIAGCFPKSANTP